MISRTFPATHPRKDEQTYFVDKILKQYSDFNNFLGWQKIHTIRGDFKLWEKRIKAIQEGKAILSLRYWSASPYNSKKDGSTQIEFARLDKDSGIEVQQICFLNDNVFDHAFIEGVSVKISELSKNDGLSLADFRDWFRKYDLSEPMVIIHFTSFRY